jgi:hypothetical protein
MVVILDLLKGLRRRKPFSRHDQTGDQTGDQAAGTGALKTVSCF